MQLFSKGNRSSLNTPVQSPPAVPSEQPAAGSIADLDTQIVAEYLRQVRHSFNLALMVVTAGTIIGCTGAVLVLSGKTTEAAVAATGGLLSSLCPLHLIKDANDRLEKRAAALKDKEAIS